VESDAVDEVTRAYPVSKSQLGVSDGASKHKSEVEGSTIRKLGGETSRGSREKTAGGLRVDSNTMEVVRREHEMLGSRSVLEIGDSSNDAEHH
jgi:hypothetical protein